MIRTNITQFLVTVAHSDKLTPDVLASMIENRIFVIEGVEGGTVVAKPIRTILGNDLITRELHAIESGPMNARTSQLLHQHGIFTLDVQARVVEPAPIILVGPTPAPTESKQ